MQITEQNLRYIAPSAPKNADVFIPYLNVTLERYSINTPLRAAAFLAQVAHESGGFRYVRELASGQAYEGRKDLGNVHEGDGVRFKGRGLIQITGRDNYRACGIALGLDLINAPDLLSTPQYAALSTGWFWNTNDLNALADDSEFKAITQKINGGYNGLSDRIDYYNRALEIFD